MKPKTVEEYIASSPKEVQGRLEELRETIQKAAPQAEERIGYGMPYYKYKGYLVYFRHWKEHIGIYALTTLVLEKYKKELTGHITGKGTIKYALDEKLPLPLIKKMVQMQAKLNDEKQK